MKHDRRVDVSQNVAWTLQRGSWLIHFLIVGLLKLTLSTVFGADLCWQLTLIVYNVCTFLFFHMLSGDPLSNRYSHYTFWEQLSEQLEGSPGLVFIALFPLVSFIVVNFIVTWNTALFWTCIVSLILVTVPKLGFMHLRRFQT